MTWWVPIAAGAPLLLLLFVAGIPAFVCFLILNLIGLLALTGTAGFGMFANSMFTTATTARSPPCRSSSSWARSCSALVR